MNFRQFHDFSLTSPSERFVASSAFEQFRAGCRVRDYWFETDFSFAVYTQNIVGRRDGGRQSEERESLVDHVTVYLYRVVVGPQVKGTQRPPRVIVGVSPGVWRLLWLATDRWRQKWKALLGGGRC